MPNSEKEWKKRLTSKRFNILREKGTERAFSEKLLKNNKKFSTDLNKT